jgi:hypothetical protein
VRSRSTPKRSSYRTSLLFIEGDTEEEFYGIVFRKRLKNVRRKTFNLQGFYKIEGKIIDKTITYLSQHTDEKVNLFLFIDRESRKGYPPLDLSLVEKYFSENPKFGKRVLSLKTIVATQMIESWFFHDIDGIYNFLKVPSNQRHPNKYRSVEKFTHIDLARLFSQYGKAYIKGHKSKNFIQHLDIDKIYASCTELREGIKSVLDTSKRGKRKIN